MLFVGGSALVGTASLVAVGAGIWLALTATEEVPADDAAAVAP